MKKRILIVEDEAISLLLLCLEFEAAGYQVSFASNGREALVLDNRMPEMNGITLLEELKQRKISIPFVFLSASSVSELYGLTDSEMCFDFIEKPANPSIVIDIVNNYFHSITFSDENQKQMLPSMEKTPEQEVIRQW